VDILHEGFDGSFWDFKVGKFANGVFVYSSSNSGCNGDKWVYFPSVVLYGVYSGSYLACLCVRAWSGNLS
jgi:hypothetical protein